MSLLRAAFFTLLIGFNFFFNPVFAEEQPGVRCIPYGCEAFIEGAKKYGQINFIVNIHVPVLKELKEQIRKYPNMPAAKRLKIQEKQAKAILEAKTQLLESLKAYKVEVERDPKNVPSINVKADADAIQAMILNPSIRSLVIETPATVQLSESGPLVGADIAWQAGYSGNGFTIAVLDTGIDKVHSFLEGKVVAEACFSTATEGVDPVYGPWVTSSLCSAAENINSGEPCQGFKECEHGTHVAGIATGKGDNFSGIAQDADLISIQVFARGEGGICGPNPSPCITSLPQDQIDALKLIDNNYANQYDIAAVNMSIGGGYFTQACDDEFAEYAAVIESLKEKNVAVITAAGNIGYVDGIAMPACISSTVSVGSTTKEDEVSRFSNRSAFLDILAPGGSNTGNREDIYSSVPNGGYQYMAGTSMAVPHVAGAYAIVKERLPGAETQEVLSLLRGNGVPIKDPITANTKFRMQLTTMPTATTTRARFVINMDMDAAQNTYVAYKNPSQTYSAAVVKYNANGVELWRKNFTNDVHMVTVDSAGNVYVGSFYNLYKYTTTGALSWTKSMPGFIYGVTIDPQGSVYVLNASGVKKVYEFHVEKFNALGESLWEAEDTLASSVNLELAPRNLLKVDPLGNVYAAITVDCTGNCVRYAQETRVFKITSAGQFAWGQTVRTRDPGGRFEWLQSIPVSVALDKAGNFYVAGQVCASYNEHATLIACDTSILDFGSLPYSSVYSSMLLKFTPNGAMEWSVLSDGNGIGALAQKVVINTQDEIFVGGTVCNEYRSGSGYCADNDYLIQKYTTEGGNLWTQTFSSEPGETEGLADMVFDEKNQKLYATGISCEDIAYSSVCGAFAAQTLTYDPLTGDPIASKLYPLQLDSPYYSTYYTPSLMAISDNKISVTVVNTNLEFVTLFYDNL
jgi:subtilisin